MRKTKTMAVLAGLCGPVLAASAQDTAYSNLGPGGTWLRSGVGIPVNGPLALNQTQAFVFESLASGGIVEVQIPLQHTQGTNGYRVEVREDDEGRPGDRIARWESVQGMPGSNGPIVRLAGDGSAVLGQGRSYWIVAFGIGDARAVWRLNDSGIQGQRAVSLDGGQSWVLPAPNDEGAMAVFVRPGASCYPDCDENGQLDFFDFLCFQNAFLAGDPWADCDENGVLDFFDFLCFQNAFLAGCP